MMPMPLRRRPPMMTSIAVFAATTLMAIRYLSDGHSFVVTKAGSTVPVSLQGGAAFSASRPQPRPEGQMPSAFHCLGTLALLVGTFTASRRTTTKSMPARRCVQVHMMAQPKMKQSYEVARGYSKPQVLDTDEISFEDLLKLDTPPTQISAVVEAPSAFVGASSPKLSANAAKCVAGRRHASTSRSRRHAFTSSTRSERRRIGSRLQAFAVYQTAPASFDVSRVRTKIQIGLRSTSSHPRVDRRREPRTHSCNDGIMTQTESWVAIYCFVLGLNRQQSMQLHTHLALRGQPHVKKLFRIPGVV
jgi:hypothetical protein